MKLDINSIINKLNNNDYSLVNEKILAEDMKSLFDYYAVTEDRTGELDKYFSDIDEFVVLPFTSAYFSDLVNRKVNAEITDDNYVKIY